MNQVWYCSNKHLPIEKGSGSDLVPVSYSLLTSALHFPYFHPTLQEISLSLCLFFLLLNLLIPVCPRTQLFFSLYIASFLISLNVIILSTLYILMAPKCISPAQTTF